MKRRRKAWAGALGVAAVCAACLTEATLEPATIAKVAGTDQQQFPGGSRAPLRVTVRTKDGTPAVRAEVLWSLVSQPAPGGALSDSVTLSDAGGVAEVVLALGRAEGATAVRAALRADPSRMVDFTTTATRTPSLVGVTPASFGGGDQVVLAGSNLDIATGFDVGGVVVAPLTVSGDGATATVPVPPCLVPGPVDLRAVAGTAVSDAVGGTFTGGPGTVSLAVGEYVSLSPAALEGCATFPRAGPGGAEYLLTAQSVSGFPGDTAAYRLRGTGASPTGLAGGEAARVEEGYAERFHNHLRELERELARLPPVSGAEDRAALAGVVKPGVERVFRVCADVRCEGVFAAVRGKARFVGTRVVVYEDLAAPDGGFTDADFDDLGRLFDDELYELGTRTFGAESDVDGDGRIAILLTPVVNALTEPEQCDRSFVAGFFLALDINPGSADDPRSNQSEVFYTLVADPEGEVTCRFTVDQVRRQIATTVMHEFQHMISFHQHVMLRGGNLETLWLNEGLSHLAEEIAAVHFLSLGDTVRFERFAVGNLINAYDYLYDPGTVFVVPGEGSGTREERGAAWLFLRWVVDQFGDDVVRRMSETALTGAANVEAAAGEPMSRMLAQWFLANWVSDLPDSVLADAAKPQRLTYDSWSFRTTYASFNEQASNRFPRAFPIVPALVNSVFFDRVRTLRAGSGDYYRWVQGPNEAGVILTYTQPSGAALVNAVPRLNVVRIR